MCLCKECQYWMDDDDTNTIIHPYDEDTYEEKEMPFLVRRCKSSNITLFERNPDSKGVSLCDGSGYRAAMYTGEDFGCVNGASKKENK